MKEKLLELPSAGILIIYTTDSLSAVPKTAISSAERENKSFLFPIVDRAERGNGDDQKSVGAHCCHGVGRHPCHFKCSTTISTAAFPHQRWYACIFLSMHIHFCEECMHPYQRGGVDYFVAGGHDSRIHDTSISRAC